jgi:hypothetical protein
VPVLLALFVSLGLQGCVVVSPTPTPNDTGAKAELNLDTGAITFPLTGYMLSGPDRRTIQYASDVLVTECMAKVGQSFQTPDRRGLGDEGNFDRSFGIFSPSLAAKWGYELPDPSPLMKEMLANNSAQLQPTTLAALDICRKEDPQGFLQDIAELQNTDIASRGIAESYEQTAHSKEWANAAVKWERCIEKVGLRADKDMLIPAGLESMTDQEKISTAIADVKCKTKLDTAQELGNLESRIQMHYIKTHEAALVAQKDRIRTLVTAANTAIAEHGK